MIDTEFVKTMARYNQWQNDSLTTAASTLDDVARRLDRGAFFKSIHRTCSHLLWGDGMWMHRFAGTPQPAVGIKESPDWITDWAELKNRRTAFDQTIITWADTLDADWLNGDLVWHSAAANRTFTRPRGFTVTHFFNHQTHHRGQIHAMLTAAGAKPDDTDLMWLMERRP